MIGRTAAGLAAMIGCCTIWGLSPIYYHLLDHVPPPEVLAHRTIWSVVFFAAILIGQRRLGQVVPLLRSGRRTGLTALAALMVSANWLGFIFAIQTGNTLEASLGYYAFPLLSVLIGLVVFHERLRPTRWVAVALAAGGVGAMTWALGVIPWIALALAVTIAIYGAFKKVVEAGPVVSVTAEVVLLSPIAVSWLLFAVPGGGAFAADPRDAGLLILSGPLTATPLILFSFASRRLTMTTLGVTGYLNPTLQFFCAVALFGEPFGAWEAIAFSLIWAGLALYSLDLWRSERAARRALPAGT